MKTYLELGPTPTDEDCAQFGVDPDFDRKNIEECQRYVEQLKKQFAGHSNYTRFFIKTFPYECGRYREVCVEFDDDDEDQADFAFGVEETLPSNWEK